MKKSALVLASLLIGFACGFWMARLPHGQSVLVGNYVGKATPTSEDGRFTPASNSDYFLDLQPGDRFSFYIRGGGLIQQQGRWSASEKGVILYVETENGRSERFLPMTLTRDGEALTLQSPSVDSVKLSFTRV